MSQNGKYYPKKFKPKIEINLKPKMLLYIFFIIDSIAISRVSAVKKCFKVNGKKLYRKEFYSKGYLQ